MASSPMRLAIRPPPSTMRSVSFQLASLMKRRTTVASSAANSSTTVWTRAAAFGSSLAIILSSFALEIVLHRRVAQRILAMLLQAFAPVRQYRPEGTAAGAIADEAVVVAQFLVVGVDGDGRKHPAAVCKGGVRPGICVGFVRIAQDQRPLLASTLFPPPVGTSLWGSDARARWTTAGGKATVDLLSRGIPTRGRLVRCHRSSAIALEVRRSTLSWMSAWILASETGPRHNCHHSVMTNSSCRRLAR